MIREMMRDKTRFNQFLDSIEGINPKILSARFKEMVKSGLIRRKVHSTKIPVRIGYFLTEKGSALKSILDQMAVFSMRHCAKEVFKDRKPRTLKRDLVSTLQ
ncbi:MAG TPA: helix-turn-helix domain-containing protein [Nitrososphaeraceae archaeon]